MPENKIDSGKISVQRLLPRLSAAIRCNRERFLPAAAMRKKPETSPEALENL
ncbi:MULTISPECIES: hypothetical protein [unclassified Achromobacter]|uniref:hypothetical protein n=1 Tax=unclassified Achromobacter TaxID=2626865 RepID=UPI000AF11A77|nr:MULTISPECIES: hypothetical protein [unclassified Achromobacter]